MFCNALRELAFLRPTLSAHEGDRIFGTSDAVEILSPGDRSRALAEKIALYLRHGRGVWIVIDPAKRTVETHCKNGSTTFEARGLIAIAPYDDLILDCDKLSHYLMVAS